MCIDLELEERSDFYKICSRYMQNEICIPAPLPKFLQQSTEIVSTYERASQYFLVLRCKIS